MKKAVFLDRDGTLNLDKGYTYKLQDYELLPGVKEALKKIQEAGFQLFILTNQSGIGRGMYNQTDFEKFMDYMIKDFSKDNIQINATFFCPHHNEAGQGEYKIDCDCRKPKPGLLLKAEAEFGPFDYNNCWVIGDSMRDIEMAKNTHPAIRSVLLPRNNGTSLEEEIKDSNEADYLVDDIKKAAEVILSC